MLALFPVARTSREIFDRLFPYKRAAKKTGVISNENTFARTRLPRNNACDPGREGFEQSLSSVNVTRLASIQIKRYSSAIDNVNTKIVASIMVEQGITVRGVDNPLRSSSCIPLTERKYFLIRFVIFFTEVSNARPKFDPAIVRTQRRVKRYCPFRKSDEKPSIARGKRLYRRTGCTSRRNATNNSVITAVPVKASREVVTGAVRLQILGPESAATLENRAVADRRAG